MRTAPRLAIAMGDAGGIGPELIAKVLAQRTGGLRPFVVGDASVMQRAAALTPAPREFVAVAVDELDDVHGDAVPVVEPLGLDVAGVPWGSSDARGGAAAGACLTHAFELAERGVVDGVVNAPMCKETFHEAGYAHLDELEYLAELTGSSAPLLVGVAGEVCTVAVTLHVPLARVPTLIRRKRVAEHIRALSDVLVRTGRASPALAVAALNPHGGEGGLLGREEIDEIAPAIGDARAGGINAIGPLPADTVFVRAFRGEFDGVVCMYHDQANIARKLSPLGAGATLYLGLPVVCATTAHGTAFDLAGRGIADPGSMSKALELAAALARPVRIAAGG